jgi:hypothetical protein
VPQPRLHPFACPTPGLRELLGDDWPEGAAVDAELTLLLPSGRRGPLASPELVRGQVLAPESPAGLAPWQVPALAIAACGEEAGYDNYRTQKNRYLLLPQTHAAAG